MNYYKSKQMSDFLCPTSVFYLAVRGGFEPLQAPVNCIFLLFRVSYELHLDASCVPLTAVKSLFVIGNSPFKSSNVCMSVRNKAAKSIGIPNKSAKEIAKNNKIFRTYFNTGLSLIYLIYPNTRLPFSAHRRFRFI